MLVRIVICIHVRTVSISIMMMYEQLIMGTMYNGKLNEHIQLYALQLMIELNLVLNQSEYQNELRSPEGDLVS